jgi:lambda family phage portal protein
MGFFTTPDGDPTPLADGEDEDQALFTEADPGQFGVLPEGVDFTPFNPDYPHAMYDTFTKAAKRDIGSGLNVSYHSLANDLEGVNFSSIRSGTLEERDEWMVVQGWFISQFLEPVYEGWLRSSLLKGAIVMPNGSALPAAKFQKFMAHEFMGRRWQWVDPMKDIQASVIAVDKGLASPYKIAAQQGQDAEDVLDDIARFQAAAKEKGVALASGVAIATQQDQTEQKPKGDVTDG